MDWRFFESRCLTSMLSLSLSISSSLNRVQSAGLKENCWYRCNLFAFAPWKSMPLTSRPNPTSFGRGRCVGKGSGLIFMMEKTLIEEVSAVRLRLNKSKTKTLTTTALTKYVFCTFWTLAISLRLCTIRTWEKKTDDLSTRATVDLRGCNWNFSIRSFPLPFCLVH